MEKEKNLFLQRGQGRRTSEGLVHQTKNTIKYLKGKKSHKRAKFPAATFSRDYVTLKVRTRDRRAKVRAKILIIRGSQEIKRVFLFGDTETWGYLRVQSGLLVWFVCDGGTELAQ